MFNVYTSFESPNLSALENIAILRKNTNFNGHKNQ